MKGLIFSRKKLIFYSLGQITKSSQCNTEASSIYTSFWYAYLFDDGMMKFNCSVHKEICLNEIHSECFVFDDKDKTCHVVHVKKPPCQDVEQSIFFQFSPCCDFLHSYTENFEATLKFMKYSVQSIHFQESVEEENRVFSNIDKAFQQSSFNLKPQDSSTRRNFNNLVSLCQYAGEPEEMEFTNCDLFRRSISNLGLSFSFNADKFWRIYRESEYNKLFERVMAPNTRQPIIFPASSGPEYGLRFLLNGIINNLIQCFLILTSLFQGDENNAAEYKKAFDFTKATKEFTVGIHDPSVPANLRGEGIKVKTGYETTIMVTPR